MLFSFNLRIEDMFDFAVLVDDICHADVTESPNVVKDPPYLCAPHPAGAVVTGIGSPVPPPATLGAALRFDFFDRNSISP